jgi:hypothetical protein
MKPPVVRGMIDRRILANYRIDPMVLQAVLPKPFRPKIVNGFGVGGISLIRLNTLVGGRIFPGVHHYATFTVNESTASLSIDLTSDITLKPTST